MGRGFSRLIKDQKLYSIQVDKTTPAIDFFKKAGKNVDKSHNKIEIEKRRALPSLLYKLL
jgi:hypothetical protein